MHDVFTVGLSISVPLIAILAGMFFNNRSFDKLETTVDQRFDKVDERLDRMDKRFDKVDDRLDRIDADLRQFYHLSGKLEGRVDAIEKRA
jgi:chaperonin cofactor prefoldin